jgi:hypothetical protein
MVHRTGCVAHGSFSAWFAPTGSLVDTRSGCAGLSAAPGVGIAEKGHHAGRDACQERRLRRAFGCVGRESCTSIAGRADSCRATSFQWVRGCAGQKSYREKRLRRMRQLRNFNGFARLVACQAKLRQAGGSAENGWAAPCETVAVNERSSCARRTAAPSKRAALSEAAAPGGRLRLAR